MKWPRRNENIIKTMQAEFQSEQAEKDRGFFPNKYHQFQKALAAGGTVFKAALESVQSEETRLRKAEQRLAEAVAAAQEFEALRESVKKLEWQRQQGCGLRDCIAAEMADAQANLPTVFFSPQAQNSGSVTGMIAFIGNCERALTWFKTIGEPAHNEQLAKARKELESFAKTHGFSLEQ